MTTERQVSKNALLIEPMFAMGQIVYLVTDTDQLPRMVTGYLLRPETILYYLSHSTSETRHYDMEISATRNVLLSSTN